jgi:ornithine decarboxylase
VKFGSDPDNEASSLLKMAKDMDLNVIGLSFHIGSSNEYFEVYGGAIQTARRIFDEAEEIGFKFTLLDIGGGFPGHNFEVINSFSTFINRSLDEEFPAHKFQNLRIISEPGTYFVKSAFSLASQIHSRKILRAPSGDIKQIMYYLDEGVYSSFLHGGTALVRDSLNYYFSFLILVILDFWPISQCNLLKHYRAVFP